MRRRIRLILALFLTVSIGLLLSAGKAFSATVTIWPDQFKIDNWEVAGPPTYQNADQLSGSAHYYYILNIPVGRIIKFVRVNYNNPAGVNYSICVFLRRKTPSILAETLIDFAPDSLPEGTASVQSDATHVRGPLAIKGGYRYYIQLEPGIEAGSINSVQVVY